MKSVPRGASKYTTPPPLSPKNAFGQFRSAKYYKTGEKTPKGQMVPISRVYKGGGYIISPGDLF